MLPAAGKIILPTLLVIILGLIVILPSKSFAELATGLDWIGIFAISAPDPASTSNPQADSNVISWQYVDCTTGFRSSSLQPPLVPPLGKPHLQGGCNFTMPASPGIYEFRMYPNNYNTIFTLWSNSGNVIARSNPIWIKTTPTLTSFGCTSNKTPFITVAWTPVIGSQVKLNRYINNGGTVTLDTTITPSTNPFQDSSVAFNTTYSYAIDAYITSGVYAGQHREFDKSAETTTPSQCLNPFINTTGGDVHSNQGIKD